MTRPRAAIGRGTWAWERLDGAGKSRGLALHHAHGDSVRPSVASCVMRASSRSGCSGTSDHATPSGDVQTRASIPRDEGAGAAARVAMPNRDQLIAEANKVEWQPAAVDVDRSIRHVGEQPLLLRGRRRCRHAGRTGLGGVRRRGTALTSSRARAVPLAAGTGTSQLTSIEPKGVARAVGPGNAGHSDRRRAAVCQPCMGRLARLAGALGG